jgi:lipopolysaccharide export system permease protein
MAEGVTAGGCVMIRGGTLGRYLGLQYLMWFMIFLLALAGIIFLFEVAELLRRAADRPDAGLALVLRMGLYKLPETVERVLPFVVLFSGMFTFWRLTRSQELVIVRAAGVSAWQFLTPALFVTILFSFFNVTLLNPIGAALNGRYQRLEQQYLEKAPVLELTGAGLWLRQSFGDRNYLLHADHVDTQPLTLTPLMAFVYDANNHYLGRIDAPKAVLHVSDAGSMDKENYWDIDNAWFNWDQQPPQKMESYHLPTLLTLGKIQESMAAPNTISFWELPSFIRALKAIGLPPARHELQFQSLLSQPFLLAAMVFFAAAFSLRLNRRGSVLPVIIAGVLTGSLMFTLNNVVAALGVTQTLPVALAAWAIPLAALAFGNAALLHMEEG